jgi:hypothetical protein
MLGIATTEVILDQAQFVAAVCKVEATGMAPNLRRRRKMLKSEEFQRVAPELSVTI